MQNQGLTAAKEAVAMIIISPGYAHQTAFNSWQAVIELQSNMLPISFNQSRRGHACLKPRPARQCARPQRPEGEPVLIALICQLTAFSIGA